MACSIFSIRSVPSACSHTIFHSAGPWLCWSSWTKAAFPSTGTGWDSLGGVFTASFSVLYTKPFFPLRLAWYKAVSARSKSWLKGMFPLAEAAPRLYVTQKLPSGVEMGFQADSINRCMQLCTRVGSTAGKKKINSSPPYRAT